MVAAHACMKLLKDLFALLRSQASEEGEAKTSLVESSIYQGMWGGLIEDLFGVLRGRWKYTVSKICHNGVHPAWRRDGLIDLHYFVFGDGCAGLRKVLDQYLF